MTCDLPIFRRSFGQHVESPISPIDSIAGACFFFTLLLLSFRTNVTLLIPKLLPSVNHVMSTDFTRITKVAL